MGRKRHIPSKGEKEEGKAKRLLLGGTLTATLGDLVSDRRGNEERTVRAEDYPQEDLEDEATHRSTTEGKDDDHHEEGREGRIQHTREGGVQSAVDHLEAFGLRMLADLFTDTAEDDHDVVDGVPDDRLQGRDEVLIDLHGEGHYLPEEELDEFIGDLPLTTGNDDWKEASWQRKLRRRHQLRLKRRKG